MKAMRDLVREVAETEKKSKRLFHRWWKVMEEAVRLREKMVKLATQIANDPGDEHQEPDLGGEGFRIESSWAADVTLAPTKFTRYDDAGNVVEKTFIDGLGNKVTSKAFELKHGFLKQEADEETPAHIVGDDVSASQTDRWEDQEKVSNNTERLREEFRNRLYGEFDDSKETPAHVAARSIAHEVTKPADEPKRINFREFL